MARDCIGKARATVTRTPCPCCRGLQRRKTCRIDPTHALLADLHTLRQSPQSSECAFQVKTVKVKKGRRVVVATEMMHQRARVEKFDVKIGFNKAGSLASFGFKKDDLQASTFFGNNTTEDQGRST